MLNRSMVMNRKEELDATLRKVVKFRFGEREEIAPGVFVTAVSSGMGLGSSCWKIEGDTCKKQVFFPPEGIAAESSFWATGDLKNVEGFEQIQLRNRRKKHQLQSKNDWRVIPCNNRVECVLSAAQEVLTWLLNSQPQEKRKVHIPVDAGSFTLELLEELSVQFLYKDIK